MSTPVFFALSVLAGMVLHALLLAVRRSFRNARVVMSEAEQMVKARAVTPDTFERQ